MKNELSMIFEWKARNFQSCGAVLKYQSGNGKSDGEVAMPKLSQCDDPQAMVQTTLALPYGAGRPDTFDTAASD